MRDTAVVAVMLAFVVTLDHTAAAQGRRGGALDPLGPDAARGSASIVGHVMAPGSNTSVRGADVVATNIAGAQVSAKTDENGAYRLERLSPGEWRVTASKGGYVTWQFGQRRPFHVRLVDRIELTNDDLRRRLVAHHVADDGRQNSTRLLVQFRRFILVAPQAVRDDVDASGDGDGLALPPVGVDKHGHVSRVSRRNPCPSAPSTHAIGPATSASNKLSPRSSAPTIQSPPTTKPRTPIIAPGSRERSASNVEVMQRQSRQRVPHALKVNENERSAAIQGRTLASAS